VLKEVSGTLLESVRGILQLQKFPDYTAAFVHAPIHDTVYVQNAAWFCTSRENSEAEEVAFWTQAKFQKLLSALKTKS
jgi:hypothetical protein